MPWSALALAAALLLPVAPSPAVSPGSQVRAALTVLHSWDAARSAAYRAGDGGRLASLYAPGSSAGARDVAALGEYVAHGWRITSMATQVRSIGVLAHSATRWQLRTSDRARGIVDTPRRCRALPAGHYRTRDVVLVRSGPRWVVKSVRPAPSRGSR